MIINCSTKEYYVNLTCGDVKDGYSLLIKKANEWVDLQEMIYNIEKEVLKDLQELGFE
jgi:hypothetical protein